MSTAELKELLHKKIDSIDNEISLEKINANINEALLGDDDEWVANPAIIQLLEERREEYIKDKSSTITLAEWQEKMKDKYGFQS